MDITRDAKTIISDELYDNEENEYIPVVVTVDHLDKERPFCPEFCDSFVGEWITFEQMAGLKAVIDKSIKEYKAGFKPITNS